MAWWAVAAAVGGQIVSGYMQKEASKKATKAQNKAQAAADAYNREAWALSKDQLKANHAYLKETTGIKRQNALDNANYQDAVNYQKWNYDLMIRNSEQAGLNAAKLAQDNEWQRLSEIEAETAFEDQDLVIEGLLKSDAAKARGMTGRSVDKAVQSIMMSQGRNSAILVESLTSGTRDVAATLAEIANDKTGADLAAFAQKMLKPGALPIRPLPIKTPVPILPDPRPLAEYDFGPEPVGGYMKPDTSWLEFGASVGNAISAGGNAYASSGA